MTEHQVWLIRDEAAEAALVQMLTAAAKELSTLAQPALVAAGTNKHDDMGNNFDWFAVQVGRAHWERTAYGPDNVREQSFNPDQLVTARAVLCRLEKADWRAMTEKAFDEHFLDENLALVLQHEAAWLVIQSTGINDSNAAFLLDQAGAKLVHVGEAGPLDGGLGAPRPLRLDRIRPAALNALHAAAPAFPCQLSETPEARYARCRLGEVVQAVATELRNVSGALGYAGSTYRRQNRYGVVWRMVSTAEATAVGAGQAIRSVGQLGDDYALKVRKGGPSLIALDGLLNFLDRAKWGDLFVDGVMQFDEREPVALLARGNDVWLVAAGAVFSLVPDTGLTLVGVCDLVGEDPHGALDNRDEGGVMVHLFDGRSTALPVLHKHS